MASHSVRQKSLYTILLGSLLVTVTACSQPLSTREKSTLIGGGVGAAAGTVIGATVGAPGAGAAIGGGPGARGGGPGGGRVQKHGEGKTGAQGAEHETEGGD